MLDSMDARLSPRNVRWWTTMMRRRVVKLINEWFAVGMKSRVKLIRPSLVAIFALRFANVRNTFFSSLFFERNTTNRFSMRIYMYIYEL